jgi:hypothetical protein
LIACPDSNVALGACRERLFAALNFIQNSATVSIGNEPAFKFGHDNCGKTPKYGADASDPFVCGPAFLLE